MLTIVHMSHVNLMVSLCALVIYGRSVKPEPSSFKMTNLAETLQQYGPSDNIPRESSSIVRVYLQYRCAYLRFNKKIYFSFRNSFHLML